MNLTPILNHFCTAVFVTTASLLFTTGCIQTREIPLQLNLEVKPTNRAGVYRVTGTTNLPEQSKIVVTGIRYLQPSNAPASQTITEVNYSILARQLVEVTEGKWEANLNLWQVAPDGRYVESWNSLSALATAKPLPQVFFTAVFEPDNQPAAIQKEFSQRAKPTDGTLIRFTPSGQLYLQVSQTLVLEPPTGKTTPPAITQADLNDGWGDRNRTELSGTTTTPSTTRLPAPREPQSNAPLPQSHLAR